ncbi:DUF2249 domain-containing protein [Rhizobium sp. RU36D]|uniref:DUF2249 domain-containing protein n=1 Tax=Rhizobium sp. RU36D TaxID=1907415 RepID=UPI0009D828E2|nr:DUF2249 domain-containing protein [Rhizobium sp. RU36D]SMC73536.1 TusA-related sulfurtransferase [Rhizobium sp. RU36D]
MAQIFRELDVRPILRGGGEPFPAIMEAVKSLGPGEGLRLIATFRPDPLFTVMDRRGFVGEANPLGDGDWEVHFSPRAKEVADVRLSMGAEEAAAWPDPLWQLDLTTLEAPEPMEKVLSRTELMEPGEVLFAVFSREPVFLMPELERRGHQWVGNYDEAGSAYRMLIRIGDLDHS